MRGMSAAPAVGDIFGPTDFTRLDAAGSRMRPDAPDSPESLLLGGPVPERKEAAARASPITHVTPGDPPFLIIHGDRDDVVPFDQSRLLDAALRKAGVEVELRVVPGGGHGLGGSEIDSLVAGFFERNPKARRGTKK